MIIEVLVKLLVPDPWSFTVLETLRRQVDYNQVVNVTRLRCWRIWLNLDDQGCVELIERTMNETSLLANPNRDRWLIWKGRGDIPERFWHINDLSNEAYVIRVTDDEDIVGAGMREIMCKRVGLTEICDIRFSNLWLLEIARGKLSPEEVASRVAVAHRWKNGLLANPNFQRAKVASLKDYVERWFEIEP